jgi:UDP-3-O-[3-hydroxymyristoyl] N-acetylglucosamine deacetylase
MQRTLAEKVSCTGIGLHHGSPVQLTLHPARADSGVRFIKRTAAGVFEVAALPKSVSSTTHATTLGKGKASISTVEHLLAALHAFGVGNVEIEVDGPEVPVMDGSAASFIHLIRSAGIFDQAEPQARLQINRRIDVVDGARSISIEPARRFSIHYVVDFAHPAIGRQELEIKSLDAASFERELSRARTFGFLSEVEALRRAGLARGGSMGNTVVLDADSVMNAEGLRWPDEFVRHKTLDLVGDLSLLGLPIAGHVRVERGGHALHNRLLREILKARDCWSVIGHGARGSAALELQPISA